MKDNYIDNCEFLLNLLEDKVLVKLPTNEKNETSHFTIQNIAYSDLVNIETEIRNRLVNMYSECHTQYQKGMVALYTALKKEPEQ